MHELIIKEQKRWKAWIKEIEVLDPLCYQMDEAKEKLMKVEGCKDVSREANICSVHMNILVNHVKVIPECLRILMNVMGKITGRYIKPSDKKFNYIFGSWATGRFEVSFNLTGDSCKQVKVGEKKTTISIYELQCGNGEAKVITDAFFEEEEKA